MVMENPIKDKGVDFYRAGMSGWRKWFTDCNNQRHPVPTSPEEMFAGISESVRKSEIPTVVVDRVTVPFL